MPSHKFHIGEIVMVKPAFSRNVPGTVSTCRRTVWTW
jgi:hypothetical protein